MNAPAVAATSIAVIMGAAIFSAIICHVASAPGSFTYGNGAFRFTDQKSEREFIFSADCVHRGE